MTLERIFKSSLCCALLLAAHTGAFAQTFPSKPVREQISREVARIMQLTEVKERLANQGGIPRFSTPEEFDAFIRVEVEKLGKVVKAAGAYAD